MWGGEASHLNVFGELAERLLWKIAKHTIITNTMLKGWQNYTYYNFRRITIPSSKQFKNVLIKDADQILYIILLYNLNDFSINCTFYDKEFRYFFAISPVSIL